MAVPTVNQSYCMCQEERVGSREVSLSRRAEIYDRAMEIIDLVLLQKGQGAAIVREFVETDDAIDPFRLEELHVRLCYCLNFILGATLRRRG